MQRTLIVPGDPTNGWLVLIGGGEFSFGQTREIDEFILSRRRPGNDTIAFLPTASGSSEYATHLATYFCGLDERVKVVNVPVYRPRDAKRGKNLEMIRSAGIVYLGGGVANTFLATMTGSPAVDALRDALVNGAVVAAMGAAASSLATFVRSTAVIRAPLSGLGLIPASAIETGFDPDNPNHLKRLLMLPEVKVGIGIPPMTALAIAPDRTGTILGDGKVAVVRKAPASVSE